MTDSYTRSAKAFALLCLRVCGFRLALLPFPWNFFNRRSVEVAAERRIMKE
jgi:hypothetical protein